MLAAPHGPGSVSDQTLVLPDATPKAGAQFGESALRLLFGCSHQLGVVTVLGQVVSVRLDELEVLVSVSGSMLADDKAREVCLQLDNATIAHRERQ